MRTFIRFLVNLAILAGILAGIGAAITSDAYKNASHDTRIAVPVAIAAAGFALAWLVLSKVVPARKAPPRPPLTYAAPVKRR